MQQPTDATVKRLFAVSGNRCAFPRCATPLVEPETGKVLGKICHIKARSPGGKRYDPRQTDEQRHGFDNLLLLCPTHHDVVDADEVAYTVERLLAMKHDHEARQAPVPEPPAPVVQQLLLSIGEGASVEGPVVGQNLGIINYTVQQPAASAPVFSAAIRSQSTREEAFKPEFRVVQVDGDTVPDVRVRLRSSRIPEQQWWALSHDQLSRANVAGEFDLRAPPRPDPAVSPDRFGLEIEYEWRGETHRELHLWALTRQQFPGKTHWTLAEKLTTRRGTMLKLAIEFEPEPPFIEIRREGPAGHEREVGRLVRIRVRNTTGRVLTGVSAVLDGFVRTDPDGSEHPDHVPGALQVEGRASTELEFALPPRRTQLIRVVERPTRPDPRVELLICYASGKVRAVPTGRYVFAITVASHEETVGPQHFAVDVEADGRLMFGAVAPEHRPPQP
jgi:hypothetical protein